MKTSVTFLDLLTVDIAKQNILFFKFGNAFYCLVGWLID